MTDTETLERPVAARSATSADALSTLTAAFETDPPVRWMYPDKTDYLADFPVFARAFGGIAIAENTLVTAQGGAALWIAPGSEPDEAALVAAVERSIPEARQADVFAVFEAMGEVHPHEPHWYLPLIGVRPERQGNGLGSAMLRPVLARCDADGVPAYLEATTERSRDLYARHGFKQTAKIEVADCPPLYPMVRCPR